MRHIRFFREDESFWERRSFLGVIQYELEELLQPQWGAGPGFATNVCCGSPGERKENSFDMKSEFTQKTVVYVELPPLAGVHPSVLDAMKKEAWYLNMPDISLPQKQLIWPS